MKLGVFIGRMQPLHLGHQKIIEKSLSENDLTFVVLGSSGVCDKDKNIFSDKQRLQFLKIFLKKKTRIKVLFLKDNNSDEQWVNNLNKLLIKTGEEYLQATLKRMMGGKGINLSSEDFELSKQDFISKIEQVTFYGGDLKNDYAIKIIKKYENLIEFREINYKEIHREELIVEHNGENIFISSTRVREELIKENYELLKKMLDKKVLKEIKSINLAK